MELPPGMVPGAEVVSRILPDEYSTECRPELGWGRIVLPIRRKDEVVFHPSRVLDDRFAEINQVLRVVSDPA